MRRLVYFVHHQGRGHAQRFEAIAAHLSHRPITAICAEPDCLNDIGPNVRVVGIPNMIGDQSSSDALAAVQTPPSFHCLPLGCPAMTEAGATIARHISHNDVGLFVSDVSAEWSLLGRLLSVPTVKIRMHGDRDDPCHTAAYEACVGMVAPFAEALEQDDYPAWARNKTFYSGGLCADTGHILSREEARKKLNLPTDQDIVLVMSGGGGSGTPYAPITMGARARPEALWLTIGRLHKEGHETDFPNLRSVGWVDNVSPYLAAADIVIASAGDNTVHEIVRVGRPFLCVPEWRYFNEQVRKAECLAGLGAAALRQTWPASSTAWKAALADAESIDVKKQNELYTEHSGARIAHHLDKIITNLWNDADKTLTFKAA